jgi:hypothetical protein
VIAEPKCDNLVEKSAWNLWKFTWTFWNCEVPSFTNFLVNTPKKIIIHYTWLVDHFTLHRKHLFARPSLNILDHCSATHYILPQTVHNSRCISAALKFLTWRKRITLRISQLAGLSIARHIITHSVETRTNTRWAVILRFTRQWVMWRYLACTCPFTLLH